MMAMNSNAHRASRWRSASTARWWLYQLHISFAALWITWGYRIQIPLLSSTDAAPKIMPRRYFFMYGNRGRRRLNMRSKLDVILAAPDLRIAPGGNGLVRHCLRGCGTFSTDRLQLLLQDCESRQIGLGLLEESCSAAVVLLPHRCNALDVRFGQRPFYI